MSQSNRRELLRDALRVVAVGGVTVAAGALVGRRGLTWLGGLGGKDVVGGGDPQGETRWQIDPSKCIACGRCATYCVLDKSAVVCKHAFTMCGYCDRCTGYFEPATTTLNSGAENQLCPTGAIRRTFIEDPYFEYTIEERLCIGCGKCVKGCGAFGNGSLYLQIDQDACKNCNECAIAVACPSRAIVRVPVENAYLPKDREGKS